MLYTYGVKGIKDDRVYLYNMPELEAVTCVKELNRLFGAGTFKVAHISTKNCPIRDTGITRTVIV